MAIFATIAFVVLGAALLAPGLRLAAVDPHNLSATPGRRTTCLKGCLAAAALALILGVSQVEPTWVPFLGMFALAQIVAPAFTTPDRLRFDEDPSRIRRWLAATKSSLSSAFLMKLASIAAALLTEWLIGEWWFGFIVLLGAWLLWSKGTIALLMIQSEKGEFAAATPQDREVALRHWANVVVRGEVSYIVGSLIAAAVVLPLTELQPGNWAGWGGLVLGALAPPILEQLDAG